MLDQPQTPAAHLPAPLLSPAALLQRTQTALELLREVVQESSAEYWYERGKAASAHEKWSEALYAFEQCIKLDNLHWLGVLYNAAILAQLQQVDAAASLLVRVHEKTTGYFSVYVGDLLPNYWHKLQIELLACKDNGRGTFDISLALALVYKARNEVTLARQIMITMPALYGKQIGHSASWHRLSGSLWHRQKENEKAIFSYKLAITLEAKSWPAYFERGLIKKSLGLLTCDSQ